MAEGRAVSVSYRTADLADPVDLTLARVLMDRGIEDGAIPPDRMAITESEEAIFAQADTPAGSETIVGGIVFYQPEGHDLMWIDVLFVAAPFRRQGIARAMIDQVAEVARRRGLAKLSFGTIRENRAMQDTAWCCGFAIESVTFSMSLRKVAVQ
jgi:GNAT superfamily N-acetyltransferase